MQQSGILPGRQDFCLSNILSTWCLLKKPQGSWSAIFSESKTKLISVSILKTWPQKLVSQIFSSQIWNISFQWELQTVPPHSHHCSTSNIPSISKPQMIFSNNYDSNDRSAITANQMTFHMTKKSHPAVTTYTIKSGWHGSPESNNVPTNNHHPPTCSN